MSIKLAKFEEFKKIGEGAYGKVFSAKHSITGEQFALKKLYFKDQEEGIPATIIREISLLKQIEHPNVVKLYDIINANKRMFLVLEYAQADLLKFITNYYEKLPITMVKRIVYQLLKGVQEIHKNNIIHRDIKPQNIQIKNNKLVKLADFGQAREAGISTRNITDEVATQWYRAPDVQMGNTNYGKSIDIWSIGCVMGELINEQKIPMFKGNCERDQLKKIFKIMGSKDLKENLEIESYPKYEKWVKNMREYRPKNLQKLLPRQDNNSEALLKGMLDLDPSKRLTASKAQENPWFDEIHKQFSCIYQKNES